MGRSDIFIPRARDSLELEVDLARRVRALETGAHPLGPNVLWDDWEAIALYADWAAVADLAPMWKLAAGGSVHLGGAVSLAGASSLVGRLPYEAVPNYPTRFLCGHDAGPLRFEVRPSGRVYAIDMPPDAGAVSLDPARWVLG